MKNIKDFRKANRPVIDLSTSFNYGFNYTRSCNTGYGYEHYHSLGKYKNDDIVTAGYCICSKCGKKMGYKAGDICTSLKCPDCGSSMIREELYIIDD